VKEVFDPRERVRIEEETPPVLCNSPCLWHEELLKHTKCSTSIK